VSGSVLGSFELTVSGVAGAAGFDYAMKTRADITGSRVYSALTACDPASNAPVRPVSCSATVAGSGWTESVGVGALDGNFELTVSGLTGAAGFDYAMKTRADITGSRVYSELTLCDE